MSRLQRTDRTRFKRQHSDYVVVQINELPALRELPRCPIGKHYSAPDIELLLTSAPAFDHRTETCPFHEPPWRDAASNAIEVWRSIDPAAWSPEAVDVAIADLPTPLRLAVESLIFEPLRYRRDWFEVLQGNHRLCALRYDGAQQVLVELVV